MSYTNLTKFMCIPFESKMYYGITLVIFIYIVSENSACVRACGLIKYIHYQVLLGLIGRYSNKFNLLQVKGQTAKFLVVLKVHSQKCI